MCCVFSVPDSQLYGDRDHLKPCISLNTTWEGEREEGRERERRGEGERGRGEHTHTHTYSWVSILFKSIFCVLFNHYCLLKNWLHVRTTLLLIKAQNIFLICAFHYDMTVTNCYESVQRFHQVYCPNMDNRTNTDTGNHETCHMAISLTHKHKHAN